MVRVGWGGVVTEGSFCDGCARSLLSLSLVMGKRKAGSPYDVYPYETSMIPLYRVL